ncbi:MAG: GGDEF domain-containing protein [Planctomycetes bacterium]|nr:GGDEF domain-containing protein [Planctomycetota bacterium]
MLLADGNFLEPLPLFVIVLLLAIIAILVLLLRRSWNRERELANHDRLTGLVTREAFRDHISVETNRSARTGKPFTLAYLDCDEFKKINDSFGHLTGDQVLKTIADVMRSKTRSYDIVARMGGDEFAILLPETSAESARGVVDRLHCELSEAMQTREWQVTFSIGVITFCASTESADEMIHAIDLLMYSVKQDGKSGVKYSVKTGSTQNADPH